MFKLSKCILLLLLFSEEILKKAGHVARDQLISFGTCFGKFTKTSKFRLHITALDFLAPYAKVRASAVSHELSQLRFVYKVAVVNCV